MNKEKNYNVKTVIQHSEIVEIKADTEQEAIEIATKKYYDGEIMPEIKDSKYCDGLIDVRAATTKTYNIRVVTNHSDTIEIKASSSKNAIEIARKAYLDGDIMPEIEYYKYCDGLTNIEIVDEA